LTLFDPEAIYWRGNLAADSDLEKEFPFTFPSTPSLSVVWILSWLWMIHWRWYPHLVLVPGAPIHGLLQCNPEVLDLCFEFQDHYQQKETEAVGMMGDVILISSQRPQTPRQGDQLIHRHQGFW